MGGGSLADTGTEILSRIGHGDGDTVSHRTGGRRYCLARQYLRPRVLPDSISVPLSYHCRKLSYNAAENT